MHRTGKNGPSPMNTMLMKESKEKAVQKMSQRSKMVVVNVPPTAGTCYGAIQT